MLSVGALASLATVLAFWASAAVEQGRERLLGGAPTAARVAFTRARLWPGTARRAAAGLALATARAGRAPEETPTLAELVEFEPEAVMRQALAAGLATARTTADLLLRSRHPLGETYAAAVALERGREEEARRLAAASRVPLASRRVGRHLAEALVLRSAGAGAVVRDRRGEEVGWLDPGGHLTLAPGLDPLLLPPFQETPSRRRGTTPLPSDGSPFWLPAARTREAVEAGGLRLTLDLELARLAREALGRWRGTIVLLEPRTGAILAAVSDPRTIAREGPAAFTQRREPASISKVVTAAAAYRAGIDADAAIGRMTCKGVERYGGLPLWCSWKAGPLNGLDHALAISCNTSFATLGNQVGREALTAELRRWGFDAGPEALLGSAGRIHTPPQTPRQLADLSIGLTVSDITPLHAALLATVVANEGTMPEPRLVANVCGPVGLDDRVAVLPPVREVVNPRTATRLRRAMRAVALYGTGTGLAPRRFPIAMKTGTAAEYRKGYHVNYIGVAPTPEASLAFCVRITYRPSSGAVNRAAREVARALLARLADRRLGLEAAAREQRARAAWPTEDDQR